MRERWGRPGSRARSGGIGGGIGFKLLVFLSVVFAFAALGWMLFLPLIVTNRLRAWTGFDATVERLTVNPVDGMIELRGCVVSNPAAFPVRDFIDLREFRAKAEVWSMFSDRPVFDSMTLDLACVTLVKNTDGSTNAGVFRRRWDLAGRAQPSLGQNPSSDKHILIKKLSLKIDRLVMADHTQRPPRTREFRLGIDETRANVTSLKQLFAPAVLKNLAPVAEAARGLLPGDWGQVADQLAKSGTKVFEKAGAKAKGYFEGLEESKKP